MYWFENSPKYFVWNSNLWFYNFIALKWDLCEGISANNRKNCVCDQIHINSNHRCINVTHKKRQTVQKRSIYCQGKTLEMVLDGTFNDIHGGGIFNVHYEIQIKMKRKQKFSILWVWQWVFEMGLSVGICKKNNFSSGSKVNTRKKHIIFISTKKYPLRIWNIEGRKRGKIRTLK